MKFLVYLKKEVKQIAKSSVDHYHLKQLLHILCEFDPKGYLSEAYLGKELLNEAVETKDMDLIEKLFSDFKSSIQYKIQTCGKTFEKWKDEIKNFFDTGITNAFTEGKNTKAKLFKRMAYGYGKYKKVTYLLVVQ